MLPAQGRRDSKTCGLPERRHEAVRPPAPSLCDRVAVEARLLDVAATDAVAEIVIVLRGTVRSWRGPGLGLWRIQIGDGHHRIVSSQSVISVTPMKKRPRLRHQESPGVNATDK